MQPIVNRLEAEYGETITFRSLDANQPEGRALFRQFGLPGHPSIVLLDAQGDVVYISFGIVEEAELRAALDALIALRAD